LPGAALAVCAVDSPFVPPTLLRRALALLAPGIEAAVPWLEGHWHPLVAAYSPAMLPALTEWLDSGRFALQRFIDTRPVARIERPELEELGEPATLLTNVNTPEDLRRAQRALSGAEFP
jgi:molybdopterin-guanine dinucleotide biosynthesis protein A